MGFKSFPSFVIISGMHLRTSPQ